MIAVRLSENRLVERGDHEIRRCTFIPGDEVDPLVAGFCARLRLDEVYLSPGGVAAAIRDPWVEVLTYVRGGAVRQEDSMGYAGVLRADDIQHRIARANDGHRAVNSSRTDWANLFQVFLRLGERGQYRAPEQRRFNASERRGRLALVAARDPSRGSLLLHQDARVYSALLERGQHVVHELARGRAGWLHVVDGEATLGDLTLTGGDGAGVTAENAVSVTAQKPTELLLIDVTESKAESPTNGGCA
ncbi:MAG: hypothetical protein JW751_14845 [Polyangiaceae bacterium]|nr:hypothetical protein [Polyangiaceae bacterium]